MRQRYFSTSIIIMIISLVLFSVIASGGCGSSSNKSLYSPDSGEELQNANAIFSGTWSITSGTAQITMNGTTDELNIKNFDLPFPAATLKTPKALRLSLRSLS